ncbi:MAG: O-methyltransferase [Candidatus Gastranaerophilales bacterium]|nr:O-methyltransferase [Candidatus Gastranaerophilales bacterium]
MDTILENTLQELEKTQKDFWNVARQTGNFLNMLVKMNGAKNILEIGTSNGYSGLWFLNALEYTDGHFTTIEFYEKRQSIAIENYKKCGFDGKFTTLQGDACTILENLPEDAKFDFVFIDANKREYVKNFELIKPHLLPNAIIAADNINSHREKVQTFLDAIYADKDFQTEILDLPGGLSVSYKLN